MEVIYEKDVLVVEALQSRFLEYSDLLSTVSNLCDPRYAFLFYVPLVFSLDYNIGKRLMWVVVVVEWTNHLLKWLLQGERPYWWVHEAEVYNRTGVPIPNIQQFPLTCETGPGSPSGHSQVTAALWYVIFDSFLVKYNSKIERRSSLLPKFCWLVYLLLLVAISISRMFIAAHFFHQCFFGLILGWLVAVELKNIDKRQLSAFHYCAVTAGMFASALSVNEFLKHFGSDPMWTIEKAVKWCTKPEYIHLETTPFYSMMRYCGFLFGMGFGFTSDSFEHNSKLRFTKSMKIACAVISIGVCMMSDSINLSTENMLFFYFQAFVLSAFLSYVIIVAVPNLVALTWSRKEKVV